MMKDLTESLRIFYSYARPDLQLRNEIEECLSTLIQQKCIVPWHDRKIRAGSMWKPELDGHLESADIILLLISPAYIASNYCHNNEMQLALKRHKAGTARAVPIILRPTDLTDEPFMEIQALPTKAIPITTWENRGEALHDVAKHIRIIVEEMRESYSSIRDRKKEAASDLMPSPAIWNMPYRRNPFFTGREVLLKQLRDRLMSTKEARLTQAQALSGLGGIGKTQIAIEYTYRHRNDYRYIFWVKAVNRESIIAGFLTIAQLLKLPEKDEQDRNIVVTAVKQWLATQSKWLLILDDVSDVEMVNEFLPIEMAGHLLLTTPSQVGGFLATVINVEEMNLQESMQLLLRRAKLLPIDCSFKQVMQEEQIQAETVVKVLDCLPLALDQAGAYIEELGCSLEDYLDLYRSHRKELLEYRGVFSDSHPEAVAMTWVPLFQRIEQVNPVAADLLRICAFLDPNRIPEEIITKGASECSEALQSAANLHSFHKAIETLRSFSLLRREPDEKLLLPHRLVLVVLKEAMSEETQRQWAEVVVRAINNVFPSANSQLWASCKRLLPQALACVNLIEQYKLISEESVQLLNQIASYFSNQALYSDAEPLTQHALSIREQMLGSDHPETATSLNNLASLYYKQGKYDLVEPLYLRALSIKEQVLGPDHPNTATSLNNLALFYEHQGKYEQAELVLQRLLSIYGSTFGPEHPQTRIVANHCTRLISTVVNSRKNNEGQRTKRINLRKIFEDCLSVRLSNSNQ